MELPAHLLQKIEPELVIHGEIVSTSNCHLCLLSRTSSETVLSAINAARFEANRVVWPAIPKIARGYETCLETV